MSIVARIEAKGGQVIRDGWGFTLKRGRLDQAAVAWIGEHKREIMRELWPDFDAWEERAAIREFDGGQDRAEAEREAYREIAQC